MSNLLTIIILLAVLWLAIQGCAPSKNLLTHISLDMNKEQVLRKMGDPLAVRGSIRNKYGQVVEVWEYRLGQVLFSV